MIALNIPMKELLEHRVNLVSEVKRYLGYSNLEPDEDICRAIRVAIEEMSHHCSPKSEILTFPMHIDEKNHVVSIEKINFKIQSKSLSQFLTGFQEIAIFAATLGLQADQLIKRESFVNLTQSLILDATASVLIEEACNFAEKTFRSELRVKKRGLSERFSPGYWDLSIELQPVILKILNASKTLGIYTTDRFQLIPSKSITAFMGINSDEKILPEISSSERNIYSVKCQNCYHHERCFYLKKGEICEF